MKQVHCREILFVLFLLLGLFACTDKKEQEVTTGITSQSWVEGTAVPISAVEPTSVRFQAVASWTATAGADWCSLLASSGERGKNTLQFLATSATSVERSSSITIQVKGYAPATFRVTQKATGGQVSNDVEINVQVDQYLKDWYLWNEEYKTLTPNYNQTYDAFFYNALGSLKTNTLDKRWTGQGYTLFSYIEKRDPIETSRAKDDLLIPKELTYSFGITGITPILIGTVLESHIYFCVRGVYPDSPAARAGIRRGTMIGAVNGEELTNSNIDYYYYQLLYPEGALAWTLTEKKDEKNVTASVVSEAMYCNPVLYNKVETVGTHTIGYLVYNNFDAGFDRELFDVFKDFKSKHVTDLILDLRYNGGGHTWSANLMATCIVGQAAQGKVFNSLRFNEKRMKQRNGKREDEYFAYEKYDNLNTSLSAGALGLKRVYCLTGKGTASSSELIINSLRGIDVEVVLIGEQTTGKNVGMEYDDITVNDQLYRVVPITFQSYNAKGFGDYEKGFQPDWEIDETNPFQQESTFYRHRDYGTAEEPLYAKAVELITGKKPSVAARSASSVMTGQVCPLPIVLRPGQGGMLLPRQR